MKKKVAVLAGGFSSEAEVSFKSAQTIIDNLSSEVYDVFQIFIVDEGWYCEYEGKKLLIDKNEFTLDISSSEIITFDIAFIAIHGTPGEDGKLQAYFDLLQIPYTTPNHLASTVTFNKWACNSILKSQGVACAHSLLIRKGDAFQSEEMVNRLGLPIFVKPNDGGSSFGVSKVKSVEEIETAVKEAFKHGSEVLIESELKGTEVTCGIFYGQVLSITEIVSENEFFDYEAKYQGKSSEITPARLDKAVQEKVETITKQVYKIFGLKGMVRVDFMIDGDTPYVIEVNTTPGLSPESIIPQQAKYIGMSLNELFSQAIEKSFT